MQSQRLAPTVLLVSMILVSVSGVAAWIAVGGLADATERALERMESALLAARDLADTTAGSASELENVVAVVGDGLASTSDALAATQQVSSNVRGVLGIVDFIGSVDNLKQSLEEAEQSLVVRAGQPEHGGDHIAGRGARAARDGARARRPFPTRSMQPLPTQRRRGPRSMIRCGCGDWPSSPDVSPSSAGCGPCARTAVAWTACSRAVAPRPSAA